MILPLKRNPRGGNLPTLNYITEDEFSSWMGKTNHREFPRPLHAALLASELISNEMLTVLPERGSVWKEMVEEWYTVDMRSKATSPRGFFGGMSFVLLGVRTTLRYVPRLADELERLAGR